MHALEHLLGFAIFVVIFFLGKLMVERRGRLAGWLVRRSEGSGAWSEFFLYSGRTIETVAVVAGLVEAVAVILLATAVEF